MKRLLFSVIIALSESVVNAQVLQRFALMSEAFIGDTYSFVRKDSTNNPQKFINAKQWFAKTFDDYKKAAQVEDEANGKIVIKGALPVNYSIDKNSSSTEYHPSLVFTLLVDIKPDRYRLKFEDMIVKVMTVKDTPLGTSKSESEQPISTYMVMMKDDSFSRMNLSAAITDFINTAVTAIDTYDDF